MNIQKAFHTCVLAVFATLVFTGLAAAAPVGITSITPSDTYDWSQLGTAPLMGPQNIVSAGGATGIVSSTGNNLQVLQQNNATGWTGNFATGTEVLWDEGIGPDITVSLANPVSAIGAQIESDAPGNFTAQVTAFNKGGTILGTFSEAGDSTAAGDGSAIFIGLSDNSQDIAMIKFILIDATSFPNDFAIGPLETADGAISPTPLPGALPMFAAGLTGLGFVAYRRRRMAVSLKKSARV